MVQNVQYAALLTHAAFTAPTIMQKRENGSKESLENTFFTSWTLNPKPMIENLAGATAKRLTLLPLVLTAPDPVGSEHCANITSKQWTHLGVSENRGP